MKKYFSLIIFIGLFVFLGFYLNKNLNLILSTFTTTASNLTRYIFIAFFVYLLAVFFMVKAYQLIFRMNGITKKIWKLIKLYLAGLAVNVIIPAAGLSSAMIYVEDSKKNDEPIHPTINSIIMTILADYSGICLFLIFSLLYLYAIDFSVMPFVWIPVLVFILITVGVYVLAFFSGKGSVKLEKFIIWLAKVIEYPFRKIFKTKNTFKGVASKLYQEFRDVNQAILKDPKDWFVVLSFAVLRNLMLIIVLYLILFSLGADPLIRVVIAAYSVGAALLVVSPTPQGIGFVEGGMFLIFTSLGVAGPIATSTIIIYRSITFWIPLFIGFIFYQRSKFKELIK